MTDKQVSWLGPPLLRLECSLLLAVPYNIHVLQTPRHAALLESRAPPAATPGRLSLPLPPRRPPRRQRRSAGCCRRAVSHFQAAAEAAGPPRCPLQAYFIEAAPGADVAFLAALCVAIDEIFQEKKE